MKISINLLTLIIIIATNLDNIQADPCKPLLGNYNRIQAQIRTIEQKDPQAILLLQAQRNLELQTKINEIAKKYSDKAIKKSYPLPIKDHPEHQTLADLNIIPQSPTTTLEDSEDDNQEDDCKPYERCNTSKIFFDEANEQLNKEASLKKRCEILCKITSDYVIQAYVKNPTDEQFNQQIKRGTRAKKLQQEHAYTIVFQNYASSLAVNSRRADINNIENLPTIPKQQHPIAKTIVEKITKTKKNSLSSHDWNTILQGYEELSPFVQQAINFVVEDETEFKNIDSITEKYLAKIIV
ncbi:MAG: hypothetical protein ACXWL2_01315 [Candidatus Chromulinivorax sp.]